MTKKVFWFGFFISIVLGCLLSCHRAEAVEYVVYQDSTVEQIGSYSVSPAVDATAYGGETDSLYSVSPMSSYPLYDSGFPSSSYDQLARGLLIHVPFGKDYVWARTGQYQYIFAVGDYSNGFSGESTVYVLNIGQYSSSSRYSFSSFLDSNFSLIVGDGLVYSSAGDYPNLSGSDFSYSILFWFILMCCGFFGLFMASFAFKSFLGGKIV